MVFSACWRCRISLLLGLRRDSQSRPGIPFGLGAYGMAMTMQMHPRTRRIRFPPFMLNNSLDHLPMLWAPFKQYRRRHRTVAGGADAVLRRVRRVDVPGPVSGPFFAIMTLAMLSAWYTLILDMQPYTNGVNGITPPAPFKLGDYAVDPYSPQAYWTVFACCCWRRLPPS